MVYNGQSLVRGSLDPSKPYSIERSPMRVFLAGRFIQLYLLIIFLIMIY